MPRLPKPGADPGSWAELLNEYLLVAHNSDGTARAASVNSLASGTVGLSNLITTNKPLRYQVLSNDGTNLIWQESPAISVSDFGAVGDGVTDDTAAIQAAIDSAHNLGGQIIFPNGNFMVTSLTISAQGTTLSGSARWGTRITRLSGTQPLINVSGTSSVNGHIKYCSLLNMMIDGNNLPGVLLQSYYADNCIFHQLNFIHCAGNTTDFVEVWDSVFEACGWEDCGSATQPALLLRNSTAPGTFGFSNDNTNEIHFHNCRWEGFRNGAVRLDGAANGSPNLLNGIFFVSCKMETRFVAGNAFQIMSGSTIVFVNQLYIAIMGGDAGFTTPIDAIEDHGSQVFMTDVYVQWGSQLGLANSVVHIFLSGPHTYHKISSFMPSESPATATVISEPAATIVMITSLWTNRDNRVVGTTNSMIVGGPTFGYVFPIDNTGTFRITSFINGNDMIKVDNNTTRPAFEVANSVDTVGFSDNYVTEKWRLIGTTGAARFAAGKFQIEGTKGYAAINAAPFTGIAMLIKTAVDGDRGLAIVRPSSTATNRLMEFQDETNNIQGQAFDSNGRPFGVGTPPHVTPGAQVTYANPGIQVRDIAGNISAAVKPSPTAPGTVASVTFSRPYATTPLSITLSDNSTVAANLYVSARSTTGFTVSTRSTLGGGSLLNFDYAVVG
jgi:hypothetical protein